MKADCGSVEARQLQGVDTITATPVKYNATKYSSSAINTVVNVQFKADVLSSSLKVSTNIEHCKLHGSRICIKPTVSDCIA